MSRQILYVAAALRPTEEEILGGLPSDAGSVGLAAWELEYPNDVKRHRESALRANLDRAMRWLAWLRKSFPETTFIAPWIASVLSGADDTDPAQPEAGMTDDCAVIERCDGIVLCGGRISDGMRREMDHGMMRYKIWIDPADQPSEFKVYDLTPTRIDNLIRFPTWSVLTGPASFSDWYEAIA